VKLGAFKGINLPDTELTTPILNAKDRADLQFAARHADLVAFSFLRDPSDLEPCLEALDAAGGENLSVVLKIETHQGFASFVPLLTAALQRRSIAVMVARGDLGVELGFERLAEVQEELLWLCEAAHVPVIWATQVLESLSKTGVPSRAEVTDAAMAVRAECVMLNKGPFVDEAVRFLDDVLARMQHHQSKKTSKCRKLGVALSSVA